MDTPPGSNDDDVAFAEGAMTAWANLIALIGTHLRQSGTPLPEVLEMLQMLHDTNEETIRSPRARASAARHLMAVYSAISAG